MSRDDFIDRAATTGRRESKAGNGPAALWPLLLVLAMVVFIVLTSDTSMTPEQRIALYLQSGMAP